MDEYITETVGRDAFRSIRPDVDFLMTLFLDDLYDIYSSEPLDYPIKTLPKMFEKMVNRLIRRVRAVSRIWIFAYDSAKRILTIDIYEEDSHCNIKRRPYHEPPEFSAYEILEPGEIEGEWILDHTW